MTTTERPLTMSERARVTVPPGKSGDVTVQKMTITEDDA